MDPVDAPRGERRINPNQRMTTQSHVRHAVDADAGPRHRIGAAARQAGVSASALRLWERQGLVTPLRSQSGYRLYSDADLARLVRIRRMRDERLNAPGILRLLSPQRRPSVKPDDGRLDGSRLRALRRERGHSLRVAAARAGLSPSFLSALERRATGASVATLLRLTNAYGVTMLDLFHPTAPTGRRVRRTDRPVLALDPGVRIEQLAVGATQLEPQLFVLAAGASSDGAYAHAGEEFMFVLAGALTVWIGPHERYRLNMGDALTFPSTLPHRWRNRADGETRLLWINTPPTF
jgi:DNA-binding transcriptional MerR regulator/quercetin dioxygenase-like cupin family protein